METRYASVSLTGRRHAENGNEDSFLTMDLGNGWYAFSVLDGISSLNDGHATSCLAGRYIENYLKSFKPGDGSIKAYLCQLVFQVQQAALSTQKEDHPSGTTLTLCLLDNNTDTLHIVHIGDSPILCIHQDAIYPLTVEDDIVDPRNGQVRLAKYIGQPRPIDESTLYSTTHLHDGDKLIICTDGLTNPFKGEERALMQMAHTVNGLEDVAENLAKTAQQLGTDDVTLIVVDYHSCKIGNHIESNRDTVIINNQARPKTTIILLWIAIAFLLGVMSSYVILRPLSSRRSFSQELKTSNLFQYEIESQN